MEGYKRGKGEGRKEIQDKISLFVNLIIIHGDGAGKGSQSEELIE